MKNTQGSIMSSECEYTLIAEKGREQQIAEGIIRSIAENYPSVPDERNSLGVFISNGCNFYSDSGLSVEAAICENISPWELVLYEKACEKILEETLQCSEAKLYKSNISYQGQISKGYHENYMLIKPRRFDYIGDHLIPFLVSRIIFCGAGKISTDPRSFGFELSQRASFILHESSEATQRERGIICTKQEDLSGGTYQRLHLICGDSLMSETGIYLKIGTMALLTRMLDCDIDLTDGLQLENPVEALYEISFDPTCTKRVPLKDGRYLTAIEMQRLYLRKAEIFLKYNDAPVWAKDVVYRWGRVLDVVADDRMKLCNSAES